jgi:hypothetical protein
MGASIALLVLLIAQTTPQQEVQTYTQSAEHAPPSDLMKGKSASGDDAVLCKQIVYTGTRFSSKECHTSREWRQMAEDAANYQKYIDMRADEFCVFQCSIH